LQPGSGHALANVELPTFTLGAELYLLDQSLVPIVL
jgi:hypothetical protein